MTAVHTGSCLCGAVRYEVRGLLRDSIACHCSQCRKTSGHYWSATQAKTADLHLLEGRGLRWFRSSGIAQRGFCQHCGSSLFWRPDGADTTSIGSGTLDGPSGPCATSTLPTKATTSISHRLWRSGRRAGPASLPGGS